MVDFAVVSQIVPPIGGKYDVRRHRAMPKIPDRNFDGAQQEKAFLFAAISRAHADLLHDIEETRVLNDEDHLASLEAQLAILKDPALATRLSIDIDSVVIAEQAWMDVMVALKERVLLDPDSPEHPTFNDIWNLTRRVMVEMTGSVMIGDELRH